MLRFETLPPKPRQTHFDEGVLESIKPETVEADSFKLGQISASAIVENCASYENTIRIRDELADYLPEDAQRHFVYGFHQIFVESLRQETVGASHV